MRGQQSGGNLEADANTRPTRQQISPPSYLDCIRDFSVGGARADQSASQLSYGQEDDFDLVDSGYEIYIRLQSNPDRKMLDTRRRFVIHSAIIEHRNSGIRKAMPVHGKHWYMCGLPSSGQPFCPLSKGGCP